MLKHPFIYAMVVAYDYYKAELLRDDQPYSKPSEIGFAKSLVQIMTGATC